MGSQWVSVSCSSQDRPSLRPCARATRRIRSSGTLVRTSVSGTAQPFEGLAHPPVRALVAGVAPPRVSRPLHVALPAAPRHDYQRRLLMSRILIAMTSCGTIVTRPGCHRLTVAVLHMSLRSSHGLGVGVIESSLNLCPFDVGSSLSSDCGRHRSRRTLRSLFVDPLRSTPMVWLLKLACRTRSRS